MKTLKITFITLIWFIGINIARAQEVAVITETYIIGYNTDDLDEDFYEAYVNYSNYENTLAADNVLNAAEYVSIEINNAKDKDKKSLNKVYKELINLANGLNSNTITSSKQLSNVFAKTHYVLARYHFAEAVAYQSTKDIEKAGQAMRIATKNLEHAARWSGEEIGKGAETSWDATKKTGHAIGKGAKVSAEEVSEGIKSVGNETKKLGDAIFSRKKEEYDIYWIDDIY